MGKETTKTTTTTTTLLFRELQYIYISESMQNICYIELKKYIGFEIK
jgi:hypothetical protein